MNPNDCQYERTDTGGIKCQRCGHERKKWDRSDLPKRNCGLPAKSPAAAPSPSFLRKAANFAKAVVGQLPLFVEAALTADESVALRSHEEVEAIYQICQGCEYLVDGACSHPECGCPIDATRSAFWSKLAWKSQSCPIGKWT